MKRSIFVFTIVLLGTGLLSTFHADDFKPEVKFAQVGDVKLAYYLRGEGEPLLVINGFMSMMSLWDPAMIEELAKSTS